MKRMIFIGSKEPENIQVESHPEINTPVVVCPYLSEPGWFLISGYETASNGEFQLFYKSCFRAFTITEKLAGRMMKKIKNEHNPDKLTAHDRVFTLDAKF
jgi:hypothetical protein